MAMAQEWNTNGRPNLLVSASLPAIFCIKIRAIPNMRALISRGNLKHSETNQRRGSRNQ